MKNKVIAIPATPPTTKGRHIEHNEKPVFSPELKTLLEGSEKPTQPMQPDLASASDSRVRFDKD